MTSGRNTGPGAPPSSSRWEKWGALRFPLLDEGGAKRQGGLIPPRRRPRLGALFKTHSEALCRAQPWHCSRQVGHRGMPHFHGKRCVLTYSSQDGFAQKVGLALKRSRGNTFSPPQRGGVARSAGVVLFRKSTLLNEPPAASRHPVLARRGNFFVLRFLVQSLAGPA